MFSKLKKFWQDNKAQLTDEEEFMAHLKTTGKCEHFQIKAHDDIYNSLETAAATLLRSKWKDAKFDFCDKNSSTEKKIQSWVTLQVTTFLLRERYAWNDTARRPLEDIDGYFN